MEIDLIALPNKGKRRDLEGRILRLLASVKKEQKNRIPIAWGQKERSGAEPGPWQHELS